jgi:sec-independent protein translocase protein TatA
MGLHMPELIIVLVAALLIFGPKKLPEMGSSIGKSIKALRKGMSEISNPDGAELPVPLPKDALPDADKHVSSQMSTSSINKEVSAEKYAD